MAKILVVDDDKSIVGLLQALLSHENYDVVIAMDGQEGLAAARREKPDLILLDVMMPIMDGFTMSGLMFQDPAMRKIPVIMLTAKNYTRNVMELGPNIRVYMTKPFEPDDLLEKISNLLRPQAKPA
jgi:DNA-binding response OmpR family regulator